MKWLKSKLGDLATIINGTTPSSGVKTYWEGQNVWVTPTDLGRLDDIYIRSSERRITNEGVKSCNLTLVSRNSVVMSSRAPIGYLGIAETDLYTNQGCKSFICNQKIHPLFLYYTLLVRMKDIQSLGSGSTFLEVSKSALENFEICYPETQEQQLTVSSKIKSQLSEVKKVRKATEIQLIEIDNLANAIIYESIKRKSTKIYPLSQVADEIKKGIGENWKDYPVLGATRSGIALAKEPPGKNPQRYKPVVPGSVFYNPMRILIGSIAFSEDSDLPGITSPDYVVLRGKEKRLDSRWFYYWLRSPLGQQFIMSLARGAVRERMLFTRLAEGHIDLPDYDLQIRASQALKNLRQVRNQLKKQLTDIAILPGRVLSNIFPKE